jgi:uncharacterized membrane protein YtjA (UPF0391 family)
MVEAVFGVIAGAAAGIAAAVFDFVKGFDRV